MKRTGEILKKTREEKGLSVHEVGLFLKINTRILQAIEEGDQSQLPAKTFLRGFVQSYAKFLKLDTSHVLRIFNEEMTPPTPTPLEGMPIRTTPAEAPQEMIPEVEEAKPNLSEKETPVTTTPVSEEDSLKDSILAKSFMANDSMKIKTVAASVIGLLLVLFVYFANNVVKKYKREAELSPETPIAATQDSDGKNSTDDKDAAADTTLPDSPSLVDSALQNVSTPVVPVTTSPAPATSSHSTPTPPSAPPAPVAAVPAPKPVPVPPPAPVVTTPKPTTLAPAPTTPAPVVTAPPTTTSPATNSATATTNPATQPEGKTVEVIVEAKDNVEIEYSSAKSAPQKIIMKIDQIHTFKSRSGVRLKISNGGAVNVIVNGQDRGAPGVVGQSIQLNYD